MSTASKLPKIANNGAASTANKKSTTAGGGGASSSNSKAKAEQGVKGGTTLPSVSPNKKAAPSNPAQKKTVVAEVVPSVTSVNVTAMEPVKEDAVIAASATGMNDLTLDQNQTNKDTEEKARLEAEASAKKAAEEAAAAAAAIKKAAEEAEAAARKLRGNGNVVLIYEQYNEEFPIVNGSTTHAAIDDVYCLSFVMPNCLIHLSKLSPQEKRKIEAEAEEAGRFVDVFLPEQPRGTYHGMEKDLKYYVYVEQEAEQLKRDQARMKAVAQTMEGYKSKGSDGVTRDDGRVMESCSCVYGNPCVDEYGCKDWDNRFAIATKNGWKGF